MATFKDLHIENSKKLQKVILFSSTLTHSQCDVGNITFCNCCCFRCASSLMLPLTSDVLYIYFMKALTDTFMNFLLASVSIQ